MAYTREIFIFFSHESLQLDNRELLWWLCILLPQRAGFLLSCPHPIPRIPDSPHHLRCLFQFQKSTYNPSSKNLKRTNKKELECRALASFLFNEANRSCSASIWQDFSQMAQQHRFALYSLWMTIHPPKKIKGFIIVEEKNSYCNNSCCIM